MTPLAGLDDAARQLCAMLEERLRTPDHFRDWLKSQGKLDVVGRASGGMDRVLPTYLRRTMPLVPPATFSVALIDGVWHVVARFRDGVLVKFVCEWWVSRVMECESRFVDGESPDLTLRPGYVLQWIEYL